MNSMQEWSLQDIGFARLRQEKLVPFISRECVVIAVFNWSEHFHRASSSPRLPAPKIKHDSIT